MYANLLQALAVFGLFFAASVLLDRFLKKISARFDAAASELFRLMSNSQKAVLLFIGLILALSRIGFDVAGVATGLGLTGFALGFALKDAISNLVAGIMITLYKPIRLGQRIELAGSKGEVLDINLRYITLRGDGATHLIPNSLLLSTKVTILSEPPEERTSADGPAAPED